MVLPTRLDPAAPAAPDALASAEPGAAALRHHFALDPEIRFLNHGSFGACPRAVLEAQSALRERLEREPVRFFVRELPGLLDEARASVADVLGAVATDCAFVRNATEGVNAVLRSMDLAPGDEILVTDHGYNACQNVARYVAGRRGARVIVARLPFPLSEPGEVVDAVRSCATPRTRIALVDHVTSPTGLVLPIAELAAALAARGVDVLVDGAHGPGMLPLDLAALGDAGVSFYTGNFHKWVCAPKGAGLLWARRDRQAGLHPAVISHGFNAAQPASPFLAEFDWVGTDDPTPWLCVPVAWRCLEALVPGGWPGIRARNRALVLAARALLARALGIPLPAPDAMIGSLASLPLPPGRGEPPVTPLYADPLQDVLLSRYRIEVPLPPWPAPPSRLLRISAQIYNRIEEYEALAEALRIELSTGSARAG